MNINECVPLFPTEEIPRIVDLVLDHTATLEKKSDMEREDDLSDRLAKRMRLDPRLRASPFTLIREFPIYDENIDVAGHKGRIDICCMCPGGDQTYFAIEAKRLHVTFTSGWNSLVGEYVTGDQGMMCFVTSKYSETQNAGAMLGYVFDGDLNRATNAIAEKVTGNSAKLELTSGTQLSASNIVQRTEQIFETHHEFGTRDFTLYHLFTAV